MNGPLLHYPLVKEAEYSGLAELCEQCDFDPDLVHTYMRNAEVERSELVLCDRLALDSDDLELKVCAVLRLADHGVTLWAALVGEASADREEVLEVIRRLQSAMPATEIVLAEFVPALRTPN